MSGYRLEYKEPYIIQTEMLKNRTHQSYRWKTVAISADLEALKQFLKESKELNKTGEYRIVDCDLNEVS